MSEMASFPPETAAEHAAVRGAVGLLDVSQAGVVRMTGGDAASVLNGVLTNDTRLAQGAGCLACLLNDVGRVRAAIHLYRTDDALLLEVGGAEAETLREAIDYYIFTEDAVVEDVSARFAILSVQGPLATQTVEEVIGEPPGDLLELHHRAVTLPGRISARLIGHSRTGEPGWDVWVPREAHDIAWEALLAAVTRRGGLPVGPQALEILRVEAGIPALGVDMGEDVNPLETGLLTAISFDKGCYLGQEVIARITFLSKPVRRLVAVLTEDGAPLAAGDKILAAGPQGPPVEKEVGWITSAVQSLSLGRPIALGYVRNDTVARALPLRVAGHQAASQQLPLYVSPALGARVVDAVSPPPPPGERPKLPF